MLVQVRDGVEHRLTRGVLSIRPARAWADKERGRSGGGTAMRLAKSASRDNVDDRRGVVACVRRPHAVRPVYPCLPIKSLQIQGKTRK